MLVKPAMQRMQKELYSNISSKQVIIKGQYKMPHSTS